MINYKVKNKMVEENTSTYDNDWDLTYAAELRSERIACENNKYLRKFEDAIADEELLEKVLEIAECFDDYSLPD